MRLVALADANAADGGVSINGVYDQLISETSQGSTVAKSVADGFRVFEQTLDANSQAVSGVNLDEELINLTTYQQAFNASARLIQATKDMFEVLTGILG